MDGVSFLLVAAPAGVGFLLLALGLPRQDKVVRLGWDKAIVIFRLLMMLALLCLLAFLASLIESSSGVFPNTSFFSLAILVLAFFLLTGLARGMKK